MALDGAETIRDIIQTLAHPEKYVRGVLGNLSTFKTAGVNPIVEIGITGQGIVPHYRIRPAGTGDIFEDINGYMDHVSAFNGRNHKRMEWSAFEIRSGHWSRGFMTFNEVQAFLGDLRGFKRKAIPRLTSDPLIS